jgi:hypothetical protein
MTLVVLSLTGKLFAWTGSVGDTITETETDGVLDTRDATLVVA